MYDMREAEWDRERAAREKLIAMVIAERAQQVELRLERVRQEQVDLCIIFL